MTQAQDKLIRMIEAARHAVAFTGAGISTECGIPDFRSPGSPWLQQSPISFQAFLSSSRIRSEAWRRKFAIDDLAAGAQPGRGHRALARLAEKGRIAVVITQNIDGLHQASGLADDRIIELHGNGTYAKCLECGVRHELTDVRRVFDLDGKAPVCNCGGPVKSATIAFGQAMPAAEMQRARLETLACDLFLAIGSSLVVYPAAGFPRMARENDAKLVIINGEPTPMDRIADLVIPGDIGTVLEPFAA